MSTNRTVYAIVCQGVVMYASTEYEDVRVRRDSIDPANGGCPEAHPITAGRFVAGAPR